MGRAGSQDGGDARGQKSNQIFDGPAVFLHGWPGEIWFAVLRNRTRENACACAGIFLRSVSLAAAAAWLHARPCVSTNGTFKRSTRSHE
jgi:hypothetical protein